jgi:uncharacterized protein (TIGR02391 family)
MSLRLELFEAIARALINLPKSPPTTQPRPPGPPAPAVHPFDLRNIHPGLPPKVRKLFDDGHFAESTFEACKYLDRYVSKHSKISDSGYKLMMAAFDRNNPKLQLTPLVTQSEKDEQEGYRFVFAGGVWAIRNPRGHEFSVVDDPDTCLDHLSFVSMLLRRLEQAGFK